MANYLYNGIKIPALPEWDTETYPYAVIGLYGGTQYWLFCANYAWTSLQFSGTTQIQRNQDVDTIAWIWCRLDTATGKWTTFVQGDSTTAYYYALSEVVWANADMVLYTYAEDGETIVTDGTLYLAATDPIPVGTITDPVSFMMGYQIGCRLRAQRAIKPDVFTIEWDGEVTEPNYNEYYCRMTERIFTEEELTGAIAVFGGVEYTNTQLRVNELVVGSDNDASEGFWLEISDSTVSPVVLISGKAGKWYPSKVSTWCFELPADGTYFVRRWDTDGKYTERVTFPNVK